MWSNLYNLADEKKTIASNRLQPPKERTQICFWMLQLEGTGT